MVWSDYCVVCALTSTCPAYRTGRPGLGAPCGRYLGVQMTVPPPSRPVVDDARLPPPPRPPLGGGRWGVLIGRQTLGDGGEPSLVIVISACHRRSRPETRDRCHPAGRSRLKVWLHYAYKVRNLGRVRPRLRFCVV